MNNKRTFPLDFGRLVSIQHPKVIVDSNDDYLFIHPAHENYEGAHFAMRLRYDSCVEYETIYRESYLKRKTLFHDDTEREIQDNALFGFLANAYSLFESFFFKIFMLGAIAKSNVEEFDKDEERVDATSTIHIFIKYFVEDSITNEMQSIYHSDRRKQLYLLRNIFTHRALPQRPIRLLDAEQNIFPANNYEYISYGYISDGEKKKGKYLLDANTLSVEMDWIDGSMQRLAKGYAEFIDNHFSNQ